MAHGDMIPHINIIIPIDAGYRSSYVEVKMFCMLPFINSPDNHRAWIIELSTRSIIGGNLQKIDRQAERRLAMINHKAVNRYSNIVK